MSRLTPPTSGRPTVLVCEETGQWALALRQAWSQVPFQLRETRRLVDCRQELAEQPGCLLVLEWPSERRRPVVELLEDLGERFSLAWAVVVARRSQAAEEWLAREAGAACFVSSPRALAGLAGSVRRWADGRR